MLGMKKSSTPSKTKGSKNIPAIKVYEFLDIMIDGDTCSCLSVQQYIDCYITDRMTAEGNPHFIGNMQYVFPNCHLFINTKKDCGQVYGVGNVDGNSSIIRILTEKGQYFVRKQPYIHNI